MNDEPMSVGFFGNRVAADMARDRLDANGIECEVIPTGRNTTGLAQSWGLLVNRANFELATELLGAEPKPKLDELTLSQGTHALRIGFAVLAMLLILYMLVSRLLP